MTKVLSTPISTSLAQLDNLCNLAIHHKATCNTPDCGVSMHILKKTALTLLWEVPNREFAEAVEKINKVEWI